MSGESLLSRAGLRVRLGVPLLAGLAYCLIAWITIQLTSNGHNVAALWPANAVLLAMMLLRPRREWIAILAAGFIGNAVANFGTREPVVAPVFFGLANISEVVLAAVVLSARSDKPWALRDPASVKRFLLWAGIIAPAVSAIPGTLATWLLFGQPIAASAIRWFTSDALGLLIFTPFFVSLLRGDYARCLRQANRGRRVEALGLLTFTAAVTIWAFYIARYPALFTLMIPLMLVTFRLGPYGSKAALVIMTTIMNVATLSGHGPIAKVGQNPDIQVYLLQFVTATYCTIVLTITAVLSARADLFNRLRESEQSLRLLAEQSPVLILTFDLAGTCQRVVGTADLLLGRDPATLAGKTFGDISEEGRFELKRAHDDALDDIEQSHAAEFRAFKVNDRWLEAVFRANFDAQGRCVGTLATLHDVSVRKQQELSLSRSASTDSLTGLLNRAGFRDRLERALATAASGSLSLAMIDVDKFKLVNDNLGHRTGDAVLQEIARRISGEVRASDAVGRLGGDEFIILLATPDWTMVREICDRLVKAVGSRPIELPSGNPLGAAISCGVACYREDLSAEDFIHEADVALYEAKRAGRNRVVAA